nr:ribonuclease H-like domain-containing protein [Tanacetum cinerariifolium]
MDVKSTFLYGKIEEEVYVCQPPGFEDVDFFDKVYKVEKALYRLHQAHRAWYETLSSYLLDYEFHIGKIDKTLFIRRNKDDILLVQVYVDDIIFVCAYARYQVNLKVSHLHAAKRIFSITDSDYAGASLDRKSTTGGCKFLGCKLISWQCKKQTVVADSTTEVENMLLQVVVDKYSRFKINCLIMATAFPSLHSPTLNEEATNRPLAADNCRFFRLNPNGCGCVDFGVYRVSEFWFNDSSRDDLLISVQLHIPPIPDHQFMANSQDSLGYGNVQGNPNENRIKDTVFTVSMRRQTRKLIQVGGLTNDEVKSHLQAKTINGEGQLQALVDGKKIIITKSTIRKDLQLEDAEGVDCLSNIVIFEQLALMRVDGKKVIISEASITRDLQFADKEGVDCLPNSTIIEQLASMGHEKVDTPLFPTMMVQAQEDMGEGVNTPRSREDGLKLIELMELYTNLQQKVLDLETTKTTQALEIDSLKRRVKKLERIQRSRTYGLKRLYKVGLSARVESSTDEGLGEEDASKQGRIAAIDANEDITLVSTHDEQMFDDDQDLGGEERLQAEEQQELNEEEKAKLFMQLLKKRRKFFAAKRAAEKRNKPPIQAQ